MRWRELTGATSHNVLSNTLHCLHFLFLELYLGKWNPFKIISYAKKNMPKWSADKGPHLDEVWIRFLIYLLDLSTATPKSEIKNGGRFRKELLQ